MKKVRKGQEKMKKRQYLNKKSSYLKEKRLKLQTDRQTSEKKYLRWKIHLRQRGE